MANQDEEPLQIDESFDDADFDQDLDEAFYDEEFDDADFNDDFSSEEEFVDDLPDDITETLEDEDWDDGESGSVSATGKAPSKGFRPSFNMIVIGGAVLLGAGVLYMQFSKSNNTKVSGERFTSSVNMQGATDGTVFEDREDSSQEGQTIADNSENEEAGFLFEPDILDSMEVNISDVPPQPVPVNDIENTEIEAEPNIEDIVLDAPRSPIIDEVEPIIEEVTETEQPSVTEPSSPEIIASNQDNLDSNQNLSIDTASKLASEDSNTDGEENSVLLSAVDDKLNKIADRLDDLDSRIDSAMNSNQTALSKMKNNLNQLEGQLENLERKVSQKASAPKQSTQKTSEKQAVTASRPTSASAPKWVLKAAQPGKAWVSQKGQTAIKSIVVGDNLEGLGQVKSISFSNGKWSVDGTKGKIVQ